MTVLVAEIVVPMARIERATSPLPRECSTTEPHGLIFETRPQSEKSSARSSQALVGLERETGIEPASSAWKAGVLPLNYSRSGSLQGRLRRPSIDRFVVVEEAGFEPA